MLGNAEVYVFYVCERKLEICDSELECNANIVMECSLLECSNEVECTELVCSASISTECSASQGDPYAATP